MKKINQKTKSFFAFFTHYFFQQKEYFFLFFLLLVSFLLVFSWKKPVKITGNSYAAGAVFLTSQEEKNAKTVWIFLQTDNVLTDWRDVEYFFTNKLTNSYLLYWSMNNINVMEILQENPETAFVALSNSLKQILLTISKIDYQTIIREIISNRKISAENFFNHFKKKHYKKYQIKTKTFSGRVISEIFKADSKSSFLGLHLTQKQELYYLSRWWGGNFDDPLRKVDSLITQTKNKAKSVWNYFQGASRLTDLKKYQINSIAGQDFTQFYNLKTSLSYTDLDTPQTHILLALVKIPDYQGQITDAIARAKKKEVKAVWNYLRGTSRLADLKKYQINSIDNQDLTELFQVNPETTTYLNLNPSQTDILLTLVKITDYQNKINSAIANHQKANQTWNNIIKFQLNNLQIYKITQIVLVEISNLLKSNNSIETTYQDLSPKAQTELFELNKLDDLETKITTVITNHKKAKTTWDNIVKLKLNNLQTYDIFQINKVSISSLLDILTDNKYQDLSPKVQAELINLSKLANLKTKITTIIANHKKAKTTWVKIKKLVVKLKSYDIKIIKENKKTINFPQLIKEKSVSNYSDLTFSAKEELIKLSHLDQLSSKLLQLITAAKNSKEIKKKTKKDAKTLTIALSVGGAGLVLIALFLGGWYFYRKKTKKITNLKK